VLEDREGVLEEHGVCWDASAENGQVHGPVVCVPFSIFTLKYVLPHKASSSQGVEMIAPRQ
jgi:hypothetical protein